MAVSVHALICPGCGQPLAGLQGDRLFCCAPCSRAFLPGPDGWRGYDVYRALPPEAEASVVHLPMWRFEVEIEVGSGGSREQQLALRRWSDIRHAWVPAFRLYRAAYHGDPGLALTERRIEAEAAPLEHPMVGISRPAHTAQRYVEPYLLALIDRTADITGLQLAVGASAPQLWALPWERGPASIRDLLSGHELPNHTVDDLAAIAATLVGGGS